MDDSFGHWLAGLIDGEGSFQIARYKNRSGDSYGCRFKLTVRNDDHEMLSSVHETIGLGRLYTFHALRSGSPRRYSQWDVFRRAECQHLVELLDQYPLRSKKREDYALWREAVALQAAVRRAGRHSRPELLDANQAIYERLVVLKHSLENGRLYVS